MTTLESERHFLFSGDLKRELKKSNGDNELTIFKPTVPSI